MKEFALLVGGALVLGSAYFVGEKLSVLRHEPLSLLSLSLGGLSAVGVGLFHWGCTEDSKNVGGEGT